MAIDNPAMQPVSEAEQTLRRVFHFTADDLDANRAGTLTPRQLDRLRERYSRTTLLMVIIPFVALVLIVMAMVTFDLEGLCLSFLFAVGSAVYFMNDRERLRERANAIRNPSVRMLEGAIELRQEYVRTRRNPIDKFFYSVLIQYWRFELSSQQYAALEDKAAYRIYYVRDSLMILSVERLSERTAN
jgi:hypothetical protein